MFSHGSRVTETNGSPGRSRWPHASTPPRSERDAQLSVAGRSRCCARPRLIEPRDGYVLLTTEPIDTVERPSMEPYIDSSKLSRAAVRSTASARVTRYASHWAHRRSASTFGLRLAYSTTPRAARSALSRAPRRTCRGRSGSRPPEEQWSPWLEHARSRRPVRCLRRAGKRGNPQKDANLEERPARATA